MICSFCSHGTDVGCTMTVANVGRVLAGHGLNVLIVDCDLSAPTLDTYFDRGDDIGRQPGLVDLVLSYKQALLDPELPARAPDGRVHDLAPFVYEGWRANDDRGKLSVMRAGRDRPAIADLDWRDFYERWEGELFFRWLRRELEARFDATLIDAGAGGTLIAAVSWYELADLVVGLCAPRGQQLEQLSALASRLLEDPRVAERRQGRPLGFLAIPCRIDDAEHDSLRAFHARFMSAFGRFAPGAPQDLWKAAIPSMSYFAAREGMVLDPSDVATERLLEAYVRISALLCRRAPAGTRMAAAYETFPVIRY